MRFRLVFYKTIEENKYSTEDRFEYFGDRISIWNLWYLLGKELDYKHVFVYSLDGTHLDPEKGLHYMRDYTL